MSKYYTYIYYDGGTPIYIGKGHDGRAYVHLKNANNKSLRHKLSKMLREGREPHIEIHSMPSEQAALELEILWIALFGRKDLGLGPLCNLTDGGEGVSGIVVSEETRTKLSTAQKGKPKAPRSAEHCASLSVAKKGISLSAEHKAAISEAQKGKTKGPMNAGTAKKISEALKGKTYASKGKKKAPRTEEHKRNLGNAMKKPWSAARRAAQELLKKQRLEKNNG